MKVALNTIKPNQTLSWVQLYRYSCSVYIFHSSKFYSWINSRTCIKRSPLGRRKSGCIRQVTSKKRLNSYEIFYDRTRKMWPFNTGDCLIEVTTWAGLTVYYYVFGLCHVQNRRILRFWTMAVSLSVFSEFFLFLDGVVVWTLVHLA